MLVDLGRNDIGRVARIGSVRVPRLLEIERFSHVMHLVSEVTGQLRPGLSAVDASPPPSPPARSAARPRSAPCKSSTSWKRSRADPTAARSAGSRAAAAKLAIAIRTLLRSQGRLFAHAGAGIVADSDPVAEWNEVQAKVRASVLAASGARALEHTDEGALR